ncbi:MAG: hypothetical protein KJ955_04735 [Nanoarchaeota archaeon]|nr:hypothetical protein [Nanoarchaeota archaeon]
MKQLRIEVRMIVEIMGAPKTHIEETMKMVVEKFGNEPGIKVLKNKTFDCKELENGLFSTFSEIEFETNELQKLSDICFEYMPSSVEILEPAGAEMDMAVLSDMFNDILAKLHRYDMLVKNFNAENRILKEKMEKMRKDNLELMKKLQ